MLFYVICGFFLPGLNKSCPDEAGIALLRREVPMWRLLRRLFLLSLLIGLLIAIGLVVLAWRLAPGKFLGVGWVWFAGAFLVGAAAIVLNAALDLRQHPLPPTVPAAAEVRRWAFHSILTVLVGGAFAVAVGLPIVLTHAINVGLQALLWRWPAWAYVVSVFVDFALWIGWFMGVFIVSGWLSERDLSRWFRRRFDRLITPSPEDVIAMLQNAPLPAALKADLIGKVQLRGLTREMVHEIQEAIAPYTEAAEGAALISLATLSQSLAVWQEEHPEDEGISTSAFS